jgi:alcohol dehydrogenase (cytochrome c)
MAILGTTLYRGTLDAHLIARDSATGELLWDVEVGSPKNGLSITAAPLAVKNLVITGVAGGEFAIEGYLDAYDSQSGDLVWRLNTIPAPGEPGHDTWDGDSWRMGGAPTWMTGSYDPDLELLYWGVGNPAPEFNGDERAGDNLYTNSLLAIDVNTGVLQWHFQFTPHDLHDWDANQVPVLVDAEFNGEQRKLILTANKNGFGYVLDRETGEFLLAHEVATQTWAEGISPVGRPLRKPGIAPSAEGTLIRPSPGGGANWWPPSYNPLTGLVHYSVSDSEALYFKGTPVFEEGAQYLGSGFQMPAGSSPILAIRAFRAGTSDLVWEYKSEPRERWPAIGGSLATAGRLVFFGDKEKFIALDGETGRILWSVNLGGIVHAAPISYALNGKQYISVAAGRSLFTFALPDNKVQPAH